MLLTAQKFLPAGVLAASILQWAIVPIMKSLDLGTEVGTISDSMQTPVTPSGYAFSIWGVIFLWSLIYGVYQFLPANRGREDITRTRLPAMLAFAGNATWIVVAMLTGSAMLTALIITAILVCAACAFLGASGAAFKSRDYWLIVPPLALLAGWIGLAVFVNWAQLLTLPSVLSWGEATGLGMGVLSIPFLFGAMAFAAAMIVKSRGNIWYAIPPLWGLAAVVHANAFDAQRASPDMAVAMISACIILTLSGLFILVRRSRG